LVEVSGTKEGQCGLAGLFILGFRRAAVHAFEDDRSSLPEPGARRFSDHPFELCLELGELSLEEVVRDSCKNAESVPASGVRGGISDVLRLLAGNFFHPLLKEPDASATVSLALAVSFPFASVSLFASFLQGCISGPCASDICTLPRLSSAEGLVTGINLQSGGQGLVPGETPVPVDGSLERRVSGFLGDGHVTVRASLSMTPRNTAGLPTAFGPVV